MWHLDGLDFVCLINPCLSFLAGCRGRFQSGRRGSRSHASPLRRAAWVWAEIFCQASWVGPQKAWMLCLVVLVLRWTDHTYMCSSLLKSLWPSTYGGDCFSYMTGPAPSLAVLTWHACLNMHCQDTHKRSGTWHKHSWLGPHQAWFLLFFFNYYLYFCQTHLSTEPRCQ